MAKILYCPNCKGALTKFPKGNGKKLSQGCSGCVVCKTKFYILITNTN